MRLRKRFKGFTNSMLRVIVAILVTVVVVLVLLQFLPHDFVMTIAAPIGAIVGLHFISKN